MRLATSVVTFSGVLLYSRFKALTGGQAPSSLPKGATHSAPRVRKAAPARNLAFKAKSLFTVTYQ